MIRQRFKTQSNWQSFKAEIALMSDILKMICPAANENVLKLYVTYCFLLEIVFLFYLTCQKTWISEQYHWKLKSQQKGTNFGYKYWLYILTIICIMKFTCHWSDEGSRRHWVPTSCLLCGREFILKIKLSKKIFVYNIGVKIVLILKMGDERCTSWTSS